MIERGRRPFEKGFNQGHLIGKSDAYTTVMTLLRGKYPTVDSDTQVFISGIAKEILKAIEELPTATISNEAAKERQRIEQLLIDGGIVFSLEELESIAEKNIKLRKEPF